MEDVVPTGPAGALHWAEELISTGPLSKILVLPDAANEALAAAGNPAIMYALPNRPLLVSRTNGEPVFSLTLLLSRQPKPNEDNIYPLIEKGIVGFDVSLGVPLSLLQQRQCLSISAIAHSLDRHSLEPQLVYKRLFIREATIELISCDVGSGEYPPNQNSAPATPSKTLASVQTSGTEARAALNATLDRADTLDLLSALEGHDSELALRAEVTYRVAEAEQTVRMSGSWAAIYDVLTTNADVNGELSLAQVKQAISDMLAQQVISVAALAGDVFSAEEAQARPIAGVDSDVLFEMFMRLSSVVLSRQSPSFSEAESRFKLRGRPHEGFLLNYQQTVLGASEQTKQITANLKDVISEALAEQDWDKFVHLVASAQAGTAVVEPVPQRVRTHTMASSRAPSQAPSRAPSRSSRRRPKALSLGAFQGSIQSVKAAGRPVVNPTVVAARPLLTAQPILKPLPMSDGAIQHAPQYALHHAVLDDVTLELGRPTVRNLPVVNSFASPLWRDRKDIRRYWYAPVFEVVQPLPSQSVQASPFLFEYSRIGVTAAGEPALRGTLRFTLRKTASAKTQAALKKIKIPKSSAVPTQSLSVLLRVPFVDDRDGTVRTHPFTATVQETGGTLVATVELINDWVRLCYGAIAHANFQSIPPTVSVAYSFEAYVPVRHQDFELAFGAKALQTQVVYSAVEANRLAGQVYLDAKELTYRLPNSEIRFQRERRRSVTTKAGTSALATASGTARNNPALIAVRPSLSTQLSSSIVAAKPQLSYSAAIATLMQKVQYATRTQLRREQHNLLYPCNSLGHLYQEKRGETSTAIGCRDALQLGQIHYRQYEEMVELREAAYRVYRSLSQPGQFLVVPLQYCVTRQSASEPEAYRPLIVLYSSIDPENPANNWLTLDITLQPDLSPYQRRALLNQLSRYSPQPTIQYPTEVAAREIEYSWNLGGREIVVSHSVLGAFVQVSMEMDPITWQLQLARLEESGISGNMQVRLPDGSSVHSALLLQLTQIAGPWDTGPVEIARVGDRLRLTNKIERTLDISDLRIYSQARSPETIPVEAGLSAGDFADAIAPNAADIAVANVYANYRFPAADPATIREVRSFVEEIDRNFVFLNLIEFSNHQLERLEVRARIEAVEGTYTVQITEGMRVAEIEVTLPLTTYLESHILQYQVTKIFRSQQPTTTPWMTLNFDTAGNVVSLIWSLIE